MQPGKQDIFNQYRENTIIEVVQALSKSEAGPHIAFKGGTALKLFYGLPRYSEAIDYDSTGNLAPQDLIEIIKIVTIKKTWEITDDAVKYNTILVELRFSGPDRNFHVKIEISTREKELNTTIVSLRGVPVVSLEPSFLMTEKLMTFVDRQAGRDFFDAWFILNNAYPLDERLLVKEFGDITQFYQKLLTVIKKADSKKIHRDTGKLLGLDHRNWIKSSFLSDFERLVSDRLRALDRE
jgi:predicted nucleotidyltransferase component of viral defense system